MKYKLTAGIINKRKSTGKKVDGDGLFWKWNKNGSLTAYQRVDNKDHKIQTFYEEITKEQLQEVRNKGFALKHKQNKQQIKNSITLSQAWESFLNTMTSTANPTWGTPKTIRDNVSRIDRYIKHSKLWGLSVKDITTQDLFKVLKPVRDEKRDQESKIRGVLNKVFSQALLDEVISVNPVPSLSNMYALYETTPEQKHLPAEVSLSQLGKILNDNQYSNGSFLVKTALEIQAYTAQRSSEVAGTKWEEVDLDTGIWTIPRARMKISKKRDYDQVLILPKQVIDMFKSLPHKSNYVFPSPNTSLGHISIDAMSKRLRRSLKLEGVHVPHGWRSALKSLATDAADDDERPLFADLWIECVLDHDEGNKVQKAYQRKRPVVGAGKVLTWWAEQLDEARNKAKDE